MTLPLATLILATTGFASPQTEDDIAPCPTGTGLVVLIGQRTLVLERPAHGASTGKSLCGSFVASALTGGSYLIFLHSGSDRGTLLFAPEDTPGDLLPPSVARSFAETLATTSASSHFHVLSATNEGAVVDSILRDTRCPRTLVINAQYRLEQLRSAVRLTSVAQLLDIPADPAAPRSTLAVLEYRSAPWDFPTARDPAVLATALEDFLSRYGTELETGLHDAVADMALMTSHVLQPSNSPVSRVTLARVASGSCAMTVAAPTS